MEFHTRNNDRRKFGTTKYVVITSFSKVSIFSEDGKSDKIIYMHAQDDFTIEHLGSNEEVQVINGPRASEIVCSILEVEKKKKSTMIWTGARFKNAMSSKDILARDFIESEEERKERKDDKRRRIPVYGLSSLGDFEIGVFKPDGTYNPGDYVDVVSKKDTSQRMRCKFIELTSDDLKASMMNVAEEDAEGPLYYVSPEIAKFTGSDYEWDFIVVERT